MTRAISPVFGTLMLAMITVAIAAILVTTVGTAALGGPVDPSGSTDPTAFTRFSVEATSDGEVLLTHDGGDPIDVRELDVAISVDGTPLAEQPPVPFFSTAGFEPGPTGPFNSASDPEWAVGQTASVTISESNDPLPAAGDDLTVELYRNGRKIGAESTSVLGDHADGDDSEV